MASCEALRAALERAIERNACSPMEFGEDYQGSVVEVEVILDALAAAPVGQEPAPGEEAARLDLLDELEDCRLENMENNAGSMLGKAIAWIDGDRTDAERATSRSATRAFLEDLAKGESCELNGDVLADKARELLTLVRAARNALAAASNPSGSTAETSAVLRPPSIRSIDGARRSEVDCCSGDSDCRFPYCRCLAGVE